MSARHRRLIRTKEVQRKRRERPRQIWRYGAYPVSIPAEDFKILLKFGDVHPVPGSKLMKLTIKLLGAYEKHIEIPESNGRW